MSQEHYDEEVTKTNAMRYEAEFFFKFHTKDTTYNVTYLHYLH